MEKLIYTLIAAAVLIFIFLISYRKAPPDKALIISGLRRQPKVLIGKAGFAIPFFERIDKLNLAVIQLDIQAKDIPTSDYINVNVDAVANVKISKEPKFIQFAAQHFLNMGLADVGKNVQEVLSGNMREIAGQMKLTELVTNKQLFSENIHRNAVDDINALGLEIVSFNVQNIDDNQSAIVDLGIDNLVSIQKAAAISRADSERDIKIAQAKADEEGAQARAQADANIAEQQKILAVKEAAYKQESDSEKAKADAAYQIQSNEQLKTVNETEVQAATARAEKELELKEKQVALKEKELDAIVRKQADAEKYRIEQTAIAEAESIKIRALADADAIRARGLADAESIRARGIAEAEALERKAEAQAKMESAAILNMYFEKLPEIAKALAEPISNIDSIVMYGDSTTQLIQGGVDKISQINEISKKTLGLDIKEVVGRFLNRGAAEPVVAESPEIAVPEQ
ncbi:MAG: flotillin family protein [Oscillospiraceae bacterium]|jgi:flotillin|nr:flotillin family protein [Oscillospiraceae bacterium]